MLLKKEILSELKEDIRRELQKEIPK